MMWVASLPMTHDGNLSGVMCCDLNILQHAFPFCIINAHRRYRHQRIIQQDKVRHHVTRVITTFLHVQDAMERRLRRLPNAPLTLGQLGAI